MQEIAQNQCEWAVNDAGNVMLALPRFHKSSLDYAVLDGNYLVIRYDWFLRTRIFVPAPVYSFLSEAPSILLVAFSAEGDIVEIDLQIRKSAAP